MIIFLPNILGYIGYGQTGTEEDEYWKLQQTLFETIKKRLVDNKPQWPETIDETLKSFTNSISIPFDCPQGSKYKKVEINIKTELANWKSHPENCDKQGCYIWERDPKEDKGILTITSNNRLMLNPDHVDDFEKRNKDYYKWVNEGLLYHEMLHGEKTINALKNDKELQKNACDTDIKDLFKLPEDEDIVSMLEKTYIDNIAKKNGYKHFIDQKNIMADKDGNFKIPVDLFKYVTDKLNWDYKVVPLTNIEYITEKEDESKRYGIIVIGKLKKDEKGKKFLEGKFRVYFDPYNVAGWITVFVYPYKEIEVRPGQSFSLFGLIILILFITGITILAFNKNKGDR